MSDHSRPEGTSGLSRRVVLGIGAGLGAATLGASVAATRILGDEDGPARPGGADPAVSSPRQPVYRWRLRTSSEGWGVTGSTGATLSNDSSGWMVVDGSGALLVQSPDRGSQDWRLADRDNDDRVSLTVQLTGPAVSYPVTVLLTWSGEDRVLVTARSAVFQVPCGDPVDLDTWWDCRSTAPEDVLTRVRVVGLEFDAGDDQVQCRVRDVRQPASVEAWGEVPAGIGAAFAARAPAGLPAPAPQDAYQQAVVDRLASAGAWAERNQRAIHIGEWAWPKESGSDSSSADPSTVQYTALAEQWMRAADSLAIPYTPWGESGYWAGSAAANPVYYGSYPNASYFCGAGDPSPSPDDVTELKPSAQILEDHHGAVPGIPPSINLVGMCFTYLQNGSSYSSTNFGKREYEYFAESPGTVAYLHDRGYRMFRLPFRWDRVMRNPDDAALDEDEWGYVESAIDEILALPDTSVIVDLHSGGEFWISPDPDDIYAEAVKHSVDDATGTVTTAMLVDFWLLVSERLRDRSDRLVYEIANEPRNTSPFIVRRYTQAVVSALREADDNTFCLIPSYPYDNISQALTEENHPFPWIEDPAGTRHHAYTLHHYMDWDQSGTYTLSYDENRARYESES